MLIHQSLNYIFVQVKKIYIHNIRIDEVIKLDTYKEGLVYFKEYDDAIRKKRNEELQKTDYLMLADSNIDEDYLIKVKQYRQELRNFMNKLNNDEIECNILLGMDEFAKLYFPKLHTPQLMQPFHVPIEEDI